MSNYPDDMFKRSNMRTCGCGRRYHVAIDEPCHVECLGCDGMIVTVDIDYDEEQLCASCVADQKEDEDDGS